MRCSWCGHFNIGPVVDCGQFITKVCAKCGKGFIVPEAKNDTQVKSEARKRDDLYRALFGDMQPEDVIEFLIRDFWGGNWVILKTAHQKLCIRELMEPPQ